MGSVAHVRAHLLSVKEFTEATGIRLICLSERCENLDLVEFDEGLVLLREVITELTATGNGTADFCIKLWERMGVEGLDK